MHSLSSVHGSLCPETQVDAIMLVKISIQWQLIIVFAKRKMKKVFKQHTGTHSGCKTFMMENMQLLNFTQICKLIFC